MSWVFVRGGLLCDDGCSKIEVGIVMKKLAIFFLVDGEERVCLCVSYKSSSGYQNVLMWRGDLFHGFTVGLIIGKIITWDNQQNQFGLFKAHLQYWHNRTLNDW